VCRKFSDFENLHQAAKTNFSFPNSFPSFSSKTFLLKYFQENLEIFKFTPQNS
jgi:hypothetical protein